MEEDIQFSFGNIMQFIFYSFFLMLNTFEFIDFVLFRIENIKHMQTKVFLQFTDR